jgi:orotidine-5'-phosphate decarboxylase
MLNVHAAGGREMMATTADEVAAVCRRERRRRPVTIGVTVLTSMDDADLHRVGVPGTAGRQVLRLARLARASGLDGVVASPREVRAIRRAWPEGVIVTPGVRGLSDARGDQKRVETPEAAVRAGADYLVVGRPIRDAADPVAAARGIVAAMARGMAAQARGFAATSPARAAR